MLKIRRLLLRRVLPLLITLALLCGLVLAWFIYPAKAEPKKVDVVLVLAGSSDGRHEYGAELVEEATPAITSSPTRVAPKTKWDMPTAQESHGQKMRKVSAWILTP